MEDAIISFVSGNCLGLLMLEPLPWIGCSVLMVSLIKVFCYGLWTNMRTWCSNLVIVVEVEGSSIFLSFLWLLILQFRIMLIMKMNLFPLL